MKNTVPPRALRGRGLAGAEPPTGEELSISMSNVAGRVPKSLSKREGNCTEAPIDLGDPRHLIASNAGAMMGGGGGADATKGGWRVA